MRTQTPLYEPPGKKLIENDRLAALAAVLVTLLAILYHRRLDARIRQNDSVLTGE